MKKINNNLEQKKLQIERGTMHAPHIFADFKSSSCSVAISLETTDNLVYNETMLYDGNSLLGELGGSLGLFLGASMVTICEGILGILTVIWKKLNQK